MTAILGASYVLYDDEVQTIQHHRVVYDFAVTQEKMRLNSLPDYVIDRLAAGR